MSYFKVVSYEDVNEGDVYNKESCSVYNSNGIYFTTLDNIHRCYFHGIYLIEIFVPLNSSGLIMEKIDDYRYRTDKVVLGERYSLLDPETYNRFSLDITKNTYAIDYASKYGFVDFLNWWFQTGIDIPYTSRAMNWASEYGRIDVLNFWLNAYTRYATLMLKRIQLKITFNFEFELKYGNEAMDNASANGHIDVLNWWIRSRLPLKYSKYAYDAVAFSGNITMVEWWENSGLKIKKFCDIDDYFD